MHQPQEPAAAGFFYGCWQRCASDIVFNYLIATSALYSWARP
ncbi:hypothetical protein BLL52_2273 [Rhodoferax antarcticus ANT.BR]|uniref:Uncharacterized protein n=1 Tax=Rhodoferax antarcticus ANT.BR TaxID=1111071 RepID=A0A1Q8YDG6_9BURK|nr:hypothetical protein BLL52_2273 [Rhodoferax antarcticus ANT.BR]